MVKRASGVGWGEGVMHLGLGVSRGILNLKLVYIFRYFLYVGQKLLSIPAEVEWKKGRAGSIQTYSNPLCKGLAEDTEKLARN